MTTKHTPATPLQELDSACNAGFRKLDALKAEGKAGTHEYMQALYSLRDLTRARMPV